jgi:hypothetical protein
MAEKEVLLHAVIARERNKVENLETYVSKIIKDMRAEGDRLFEAYGADAARPTWQLAQRLERSLRLSKVRGELESA